MTDEPQNADRLTNVAAPDETPAEQEKPDNPWSTLGWGVLMIGLGIGGYFLFANLEESGGSVRMNVIVLLVYKILGKYGVLAVFSAIGALLILVGAKGIAKGKQS